MKVGDVALLEVDDAVGDAGQRHRVGRQEVLVRAFERADAKHERRAVARADDPLRLVAAEHRDRIGAAQARHGALHRLEQIAFVQAVDQVGDDLGVGLARERIVLRAQAGAQFVVVLDDPVVDQRDPAAAADAGGLPAVLLGAVVRPGSVRKVRVRVVHDRRAWVAQRVWAMR